ncbi:MAG: cob(I)yrinic acid a,c-diamide adenosyltransferase [Methylocystis sp.]|nr:cob(I)yrinic acid a,c-diamide adenosyltransferase [Methylocystis sp.]
MTLYTGKGDRGATSLFSGRRAPKCDPLVAAIGDLDELSAAIGFARVAYPAATDLLRSIQRALYKIGAVLSAEKRKVDISFDEAEVEALEAEIDRASDALPELREFIFPGEAEPSSRLHMARAVARRAERSISALTEPGAPDAVLAYLNRLSDLLFVLARRADQMHGYPETALRA